MDLVTSKQFAVELGLARGTFGRKLSEHRRAVDAGRLAGPRIEPDEVVEFENYNIHLWDKTRVASVLNAFGELDKLAKN